MLEVIDKLLAFLDKYLPGLLAGFFLGSRRGRKVEAQSRMQIHKLRYKVNRLENEKRIKKHNASLSDDDLKSELLDSAKPDLSNSSGDGDSKE